MDNNIDMGSLMNLLSKMDKKDLEASIKKAKEFMNSSNKDKIMEEISKQTKNK